MRGGFPLDEEEQHTHTGQEKQIALGALGNKGDEIRDVGQLLDLVIKRFLVTAHLSFRDSVFASRNLVIAATRFPLALAGMWLWLTVLNGCGALRHSHGTAKCATVMQGRSARNDTA